LEDEDDMSSNDFLSEFVEDVREHIQELERSLLVLEREGSNREQIGEVFRVAHSIKGAAAYMGFERLANLTHELESLISVIQKESRPIPPKGISILLEFVDFISHAMTHLLERGEEPPFASSLLKDLQRVFAMDGTDESVDTASLTDGSAEAEQEDGEEPILAAPDRWETEGKGVVQDVAERPRASAGPGVELGANDHERFSRFLISFRANYWDLVNMFAFSLERTLSEADFKRSQDLIQALISSCKDVKYKPMEKVLKEWKKRLLKSYKKGTLERHLYAELLNSYGRQLQEMLPTLELPALAFDAPEAGEPEKAAKTEETIREEDEELFNIFIETFRENLSALGALTPPAPEASLSEGDIEVARGLIRKLITSSHYMDYESILTELGKWEESLVQANAKGPVDGRTYGGLFEACARRFREILPGLEVPSVPLHAEATPEAEAKFEEEDAELLAIFVESFLEHFSSLAAIAPPAPESVMSPEDLDRAGELIRKLLTSARYMDYGQVQEGLKAWGNALIELQQQGGVVGRIYREMVNAYGLQFGEMLPQLELPAVTAFPEAAPHEEAPLEEEDAELFAIFLDTFREHFSALANLAPASARDPFSESALDQARDTLRKLVSSARYMDYEQLVEGLEKWDASLVEFFQRGALDGQTYVELLDANGRGFTEMLPRLQLAVLSSSTEEAPAWEGEKDEEDAELLAIFLDTFREHFSTLANLAPASAEALLSEGDFQLALESIRKLISSSRYMDYGSILDTLAEWENALVKAHGHGVLEGRLYSDLLNTNGQRFGEILPALQLPIVTAISDEAPMFDEEIQEEDEELLAIFLDTFREHFTTLAALTPRSPQINLSDAEIERAREAIKRLTSSARYMDYDQVVCTLEKWDESLCQSHEDGEVGGHLYSELLTACCSELQEIMPGLGVAELVPSHKAEPAFTPFSPEPSHTPFVPEGPAIVSMDSVLGTAFQEARPLPEEWLRPVEGKGPQEPFVKHDEKRPALKVRPAAISEEAAVSATLRVDAQKVDQLLNQVGELVVRRSEFVQASAIFRDLLREFTMEGKLSKEDLRRLKLLGMKLNESTQYLGRVTSDLQGSVMRVRLLPISQLFQRFPRVVRDQALKLGKRVELLIEGGETEIDKRVLEQMHDPLVQFLRNAIAHGIESPEERMLAGKPESGTVRLAAYHEGDYVVLRIEDDGRGIDIPKLRRIMKGRKEMGPYELDTLSDRQLMYGIFLPGVSTRDSVDGTAGRGVGLDVVKENVERMNGSIEVDSHPGMGTRFIIRIPLTLAIIRALLVKGADQVFTLPMRSISEILRYNPEDSRNVEGYRVISIRGRTFPMVHLGQLLNMGDDSRANGHRFVVIVNTSFREVGLVVDGLLGEREVVIKPIEDDVHDFEGFSGATVLGDGTISLILDVSSLLKTMKIATANQPVDQIPYMQ
jgi:two-component system, chemotaxis family, sensor kinase CheA